MIAWEDIDFLTYYHRIRTAKGNIYTIVVIGSHRLA